MADTGHHGHGTGSHCTGKLLVVEGHEVLEGAAAAHQQDAVGRRRDGGGTAQALDKLGRRTLALNLGAHADKLDERIAPTQCTLDVVDYRTGKRGDDRHAGAEHRDAALARFVHQALAA